MYPTSRPIDPGYEFYAGDSTFITDAFLRLDFESLRTSPLVRDWANCERLIGASYWDIFSEQASEFAGHAKLLLDNSFTQVLGALEDDEGLARVISREWISMVASIPESSMPALAKSWMQALVIEEGLNGSNNEEQATLLEYASAVTRVCKTAIAAHVDVVHVWY